MQLTLQGFETNARLALHYRSAFEEAVELAVVSAYLTEWDASLTLNPKCRQFKMIVGKDFGITRRRACEAVIKWLPPSHKSDFLVADGIACFHPKAAFWKTAEGNCYALVGSSNLTQAAFKTNVEANAFNRISRAQYEGVQQWLHEIVERSVTCTTDWLQSYQEANIPRTGGRRGTAGLAKAEPLAPIPLPIPRSEKLILVRRGQARAHARLAKKFHNLFRACAQGKITSALFYERLPSVWSGHAGNRIQGWGFEMRGKAADYRAIARSFLRICDATLRTRDDVVRQEIDSLAEQENPARGAFLSEMLCLEFPRVYPILNGPVDNFLRRVRYRAPRGASEGARYIHVARSLRAALRQNPDHPARSLLELDGVLYSSSRGRGV